MNNAVRDARAFRDLLLEQYDFTEKRAFSLFNEEATKDNILDILREFEDGGSQQLTNEDNLLIYFAGHGSMNSNRSTGYWVPVAASASLRHRHKFLSNSDLKESLEQIGAHHIYIVSDACFSGSLITRSDGVEKLYENKPSRRVLTSGQLEKVLDGSPGNHSPFAEALLTCLRNPGEVLLAQELEMRVVRHYLNTLKKLGHTLPDTQRPAASHLTGLDDDGGQFVFRPLYIAERHWQEALSQNTQSAWLDYVRRYRLIDHGTESERVIEALERIEQFSTKTPADPAATRRLKGKVGGLEVDIARFKREKAALEAQLLQEKTDAQTLQAEYEEALEEMRTKEISLLADVVMQESRVNELEEEQKVFEAQSVSLKAQIAELEIHHAERVTQKLRADEVKAIKKNLEAQITSLKSKTAKLKTQLIKTQEEGAKAYEQAAERAWKEQFSETPRIGDLERYLQWFPIGPNAELASKKLETFKRLHLPEMVLIEGGTFRMGSHEYKNQKPIHSVTLSDFEIGRYPVTQREWKSVMGNNPSTFHGDELPVENVSWKDCLAFLRRLKKQTGFIFRLPTEAEWEYAAGGGNLDRTMWSGTNNEKELEGYAWYKTNSAGRTHPIGQKKPNELGLYDMTGNVWEWCEDRFGLYPSRPQTNPKGPGPEKGESRVLRGGSWEYSAGNCRVFVRLSDSQLYCNGDLGFRLARQL